MKDWNFQKHILHPIPSFRIFMPFVIPYEHLRIEYLPACQPHHRVQYLPGFYLATIRIFPEFAGRSGVDMEQSPVGLS